MIYTNAVSIVLLLINIILLLHCCCHHQAHAYTQVGVDGSGISGDGPKIYKAVNFDLIFPKSFNSSENVFTTTPESIPSPSQTAVTGQPFYPLSQTNEPKTYNRETQATAIIANDQQQKRPTLYVTPPPVEKGDIKATAAASNEAGIYERQQNTNGNKYIYNNEPAPPHVVAQNPINIQQQQHKQQQLQYEQYQQLNVNNNDKMQQHQQQQQRQQNLATGRAVDYQSGYPFGQLITPLIKNTPQPMVVSRKPVTSYSSFPSSSSSSSPSNVGKIIYPQAMYQRKPPSQAETDKLRGKGYLRDRFSPSEGVASLSFKHNHDHSHNHDHFHNHAPASSSSGKTPSASNTVNSFVASNNLYSFPPNNINYPVMAQGSKIALQSGQINSYTAPASGPIKDSNYNQGNKVNSYVPPASGPLKNSNYNLVTTGSSNSPYQYKGPVSISYLPPPSEDGKSNDDAKYSDGGGEDGDLDSDPGDDLVGVLPASAMDQVNSSNMGNSGNIDMSAGGGGNMATAIGDQDVQPNAGNNYDTEKEYPTPPPGWLEEHPEAAQALHDPAHDHDHQHPDIIFDHEQYHHHGYIPSSSDYPSYPHIIYDDHKHEHLAEMATTTEASPPPEPRPEPRVKKYSYFYIGRKLWYIPLYFTVWFSFYVLWLILKSIARHKVNLPNHYVARRSVINYDLDKMRQQTTNQLAVAVLDRIEKFKRKYSI